MVFVGKGKSRMTIALNTDEYDNFPKDKKQVLRECGEKTLFYNGGNVN